MGKTSDKRLKEIVITLEDLRELEESQTPLITTPVLNDELTEILDFMKQRKFVTYYLVAKKLGIRTRVVRNRMDALREMGLIDRLYEFIKSYDSIHRKTALHFIVDKSKPKKKKSKKA